MKFSINDLVTFVQEILDGKLHFLCSEWCGKPNAKNSLMANVSFIIPWNLKKVKSRSRYEKNFVVICPTKFSIRRMKVILEFALYLKAKEMMALRLKFMVQSTKFSHRRYLLFSFSNLANNLPYMSIFPFKVSLDFVICV